MKKWNNLFDTKREVNGKTITIGVQNFTDWTVMVKDENDKIFAFPMLSDEKGNYYFIYDNMGIYISDYLGNFSFECQ